MKKFFALLIMILSMSGALAQSNISSEGCTTGIDRCAPPPQPHPCPAGMQWSTMGTGIAHCVANTPICTGGTQLQVDSNGNPSCVPPPTCANGATNYPACTSFPTCPNGATNYPACTSFPTCPNGATNYPACNAVPTCPNGATNYPACNAVPTCPNGGTDYPTCTPPAPICPYPNTMQSVPQSPVAVCLHPFVSVVLNQNVPSTDTVSFPDANYSAIYESGMNQANTGLEGIGSLAILHSMIDRGGNDPRPVLLIFYGMYNACSYNSYDDGTNFTIRGFGSFGC